METVHYTTWIHQVWSHYEYTTKSKPYSVFMVCVFAISKKISRGRDKNRYGSYRRCISNHFRYDLLKRLLVCIQTSLRALCLHHRCFCARPSFLYYFLTTAQSLSPYHDHRLLLDQPEQDAQGWYLQVIEPGYLEMAGSLRLCWCWTPCFAVSDPFNYHSTTDTFLSRTLDHASGATHATIFGFNASGILVFTTHQEQKPIASPTWLYSSTAMPNPPTNLILQPPSPKSARPREWTQASILTMSKRALLTID